MKDNKIIDLQTQILKLQAEYAELQINNIWRGELIEDLNKSIADLRKQNDKQASEIRILKVKLYGDDYNEK